MSHYAVLVLHKEDQNINTLLSPYNENLEVEPYLKLTNNEVIAKAKEEYDDNYSEKELIKKYAEDYGYIILDDGLYSTYNPNSKWDWYEIGGRFSGKLELTEAGRINAANEIEKKYHTDIDMKNLREDSNYMKHVDSAPLKFVKWTNSLTFLEKEKIRRWWEINIYDAPLKEGEEKDKYFFYNPEYYKRRYKDAETDIKTQEMITFYAVITPDGAWYAPAEMGWWGCSLGEPEDELQWDLEFYDRFIKPNLDSDLICTVVDCHI